MQATNTTSDRSVIPRPLMWAALAVALLAIGVAALAIVRDAGVAGGSHGAIVSSPLAQHQAVTSHERMGHVAAHPTGVGGHDTGSQLVEQKPQAPCVALDGRLIAPDAACVAQPHTGVNTW
ncbi:MAG TPA: hypothetical protein VMM78_12820 [Thermomicrobiales bacterium]|nr:hypothetical protein [Thermomicrobiales bacterium]